VERGPQTDEQALSLLDGYTRIEAEDAYRIEDRGHADFRDVTYGKVVDIVDRPRKRPGPRRR